MSTITPATAVQMNWSARCPTAMKTFTSRRKPVCKAIVGITYKYGAVIKTMSVSLMERVLLLAICSLAIYAVVISIDSFLWCAVKLCSLSFLAVATCVCCVNELMELPNLYFV